MSPQELQKYFDSFVNFESHLQHVTPARFNLQRVETLLNYLGAVHTTLPSIHVAGTNGKGSVCAFISSILQQAGYKAGLYTSPHLEHFTERIRVLAPKATMTDFAGKISEEKLGRIVEAIFPSVETVRERKDWGELTLFELWTVIALNYFQEEQVDWAVLETGLGGRLDATNVVHSKVCALTSIGLEHTKFLGDTIERIAVEKAAIIKTKGQRVVVAPQTKEVMAVIENRCREFDIVPVVVGKDIRCEQLRQSAEGEEFKIKTKKNEYRLKTSLIGEHQMINAAVAVGIAEALREKKTDIEAEAFEQGIEKASWPGRFEVASKNPYVILDGAHNPLAAEALVAAIQKIFPKKKVVLILGFSEDKDRKNICQILAPVAGEIILTKASHPRASVLKEDEAEKFFPGLKVTNIPNVEKALECAKTRAGKDKIIVVTGSIFLVGEMRKLGCTCSL